MKTTKKDRKPFDCVESKRRAQSRIYRRIEGMTADQEAAYFDRATRGGPFAQLWQELVTDGRKARTSGRLSRGARVG
ncbi:MAG TPA: hypothetical protein VK797_03675 [Tepidisphaeraceae bacterium]|nr:hypothetical protein [Tepidisphaeraceae bacterium]